MKKTALLFIFTVLSGLCFALEVKSPNSKILLDFDLNTKGQPCYSVQLNGQEVIAPSSLGVLLEDGDFSSDMEIISTKVDSLDETWEPVWGEVKTVRNHYNELAIRLNHKGDNRKMIIRFRVFDDGVGFRYEWERQPGLTYFRIQEEVTEFNQTGDHKAFWLPGAYDSNEFRYATTKMSEINALEEDGSGIGTNDRVAENLIQSPVLLKTDKGVYMTISEAALIDYPAMCLWVDKEKYQLKSALVPSAVGTKAFLQTPCTSAWRTIIVSDQAADIMASKMIYNLNEPCAIEDPSFIHPQKFVGIWWEMHIPNHSSWNYADMANVKLKGMDWNAVTPNGRHGATTQNAKKYIDFAAKHGFDGVLIEGWNVGWEDWAHLWKEEVFDFVTPYPDFDIQEVNAYAKAKGVKIVMHHETSASATNYERRVDDAIDLMKKYGYNTVKTGYVGRIIPRGEHHDGQWMVNHYQRITEKMAKNGIMLDAHEPVRPTGIARTYPNLMACEAARGNEFNAWSTGNLPEHETILPFTRLLGGPMDYTPGIFETKMSYYQPGNPCQVHTTLVKQLALYVTMYSPLQMVADLPENYDRFPDAFQFIKEVAVDWDDTKILEAEPGDYITVARLAADSEEWFVGAITDENARTAHIDLSFLPKGKYEAIIYQDGKDADWKENPQSYVIKTKRVSAKTKLNIPLAAGGGCAVQIKPLARP